MAKLRKLMHVPNPQIERQCLNVEIPPSTKKTIVQISVEFIQVDENPERPNTPAFMQFEPLLGDGLVPPNKVRYAGYEYELTDQQWQLLHLLMATFEHRLPMDKVIRRLWPDGKGNEGRLRTLCSRLSNALSRMNSEFRVETKRDSGFEVVGIKGKGVGKYVCLDYRDE